MKTITVDFHIPKHSFDRAKVTLRQDVVVGSLKIPSGFTTDLITSPRCIWPLIPPWGKHALSAIAHDYRLNRGMLRKEADELFLHDLKKHDNTDPSIAYLLYMGVRLYSYYRLFFKKA